MAVRKRGQSFQVYWRDKTGRIRSKTFKSRLEAEEEDQRIKTQQKSEDPLKSSTLVVVYMEYLKTFHYTPSRIKSQYIQFRFFLAQIGDMEVRDITPQVLKQVIHAIQQQGLAPSTIHTRLSNLRAVINYAADKGYCQPIKFPTIPASRCKTFIPPTPDEIDAMYAAAPPHIQRVILIGAYCGIRVGPSEMFSLTWQDVDLRRAIIRIHTCRKNEAEPYREVPIRESLLPLFLKWREEDTCQYVINFRGKPIEDITTAWRKMLQRAGITRNIRPYDLRHAFCTELVAAGIDIGTVAKLMGHSTPTMLLNHYQYVMDRQKRQAVELLPPPPCMSLDIQAQKKSATVADFMGKS